MDARTLLLGDWGRVIRDPIDVVRLTFVVGIVVYAIDGDGKGFGNMVVGALAAGLARAVNLPRPYDLSFVLAMVLTQWGEALGVYDQVEWYDNLVHTLVPGLTAPVAYIALARLDVLPDPRDDTPWRREVGIFVVTLSLGLAIGAVWEMVEWSSDTLFGSSLQIDNDDTVGDLFFDGLGAIGGAALLVLWTVKGWGSVRRIPGENRFEDVSA